MQAVKKKTENNSNIGNNRTTHSIACKSAAYSQISRLNFKRLFNITKSNKVYLFEHTYCNRNKINPFVLDIMRESPKLKHIYEEFTKGKTNDELLGTYFTFNIDEQFTLVILFTIKGEYSNFRIDEKISNKLIDEILRECDVKSIAFRTYSNHDVAEHTLYNFDAVEEICSNHNKELHIFKCSVRVAAYYQKEGVNGWLPKKYVKRDILGYR